MHYKIGLATIATVIVNLSMEHAAVVLGLVPILLGQTIFFLCHWVGREMICFKSPNVMKLHHKHAVLVTPCA